MKIKVFIWLLTAVFFSAAAGAAPPPTTTPTVTPTSTPTVICSPGEQSAVVAPSDTENGFATASSSIPAVNCDAVFTGAATMYLNASRDKFPDDGLYVTDLTFLRFDTSSFLPPGNLLTSASLRGFIESLVDGGESRSVDVRWWLQNPTPTPLSCSDFANIPGGPIGKQTALTDLTPGTAFRFVLSNFGNVNTTGYTGLRVWMSNGTTPTTVNQVVMGSTTDPGHGPVLELCFAPATPTVTITNTVTLTPTPTRTLTLTPSQTKTITPTSTRTPTVTSTLGVGSPSQTPSQTGTRTLTSTVTLTPTRTLTLAPGTASETPTQTQTPTRTLTRTVTITRTPSLTKTPTMTFTLTQTPTQTQTFTPAGCCNCPAALCQPSTAGVCPTPCTFTRAGGCE